MTQLLLFILMSMQCNSKTQECSVTKYWVYDPTQLKEACKELEGHPMTEKKVSTSLVAVVAGPKHLMFVDSTSVCFESEDPAPKSVLKPQ